jgi:hypothetical protein
VQVKQTANAHRPAQCGEKLSDEFLVHHAGGLLHRSCSGKYRVFTVSVLGFTVKACCQGIAGAWAAGYMTELNVFAWDLSRGTLKLNQQEIHSSRLQMSGFGATGGLAAQVAEVPFAGPDGGHEPAGCSQLL